MALDRIGINASDHENDDDNSDMILYIFNARFSINIRLLCYLDRYIKVNFNNILLFTPFHDNT
jgi:hypothetical protein